MGRCDVVSFRRDHFRCDERQTLEVDNSAWCCALEGVPFEIMAIGRVKQNQAGRPRDQ